MTIARPRSTVAGTSEAGDAHAAAGSSVRPDRPERAGWLAVLALSLAACAPVPRPVFEPAEPAAFTPDGLLRVRDSGFRRAWIRPDAWVDRYDGIVGKFVGIAYRDPPQQSALAPPGRDHYALPVGMERELLAGLAEIFAEELGGEGGLRLADAAGPGVLRARFVLLDLVVHAPLARFPDEDRLWIDSAGEFTVAIDLRDSVSDERLARFVEREYLAREGLGPVRATPGPVSYEARRIFRRWARNLRLVIESLRASAA